MSFSIKKIWKTIPISDVVKIIRGVTYNKNEAKNLPSIGLLPVLRANNIQNGELIFSDLVYVPEKNISSEQRVKKGDIIVAMSSGSKSIVGKTAWSENDWNGGFGAFCGLLRPSHFVDNSYVYRFTCSLEYRNKISELSAGVHINNLKPSHFDEILIPLPPLTEQKEIAAQLDNLLAQVDTIKSRLDKMPDIIKKFRQSVLSAAVTGKLTEEWRFDYAQRTGKKLSEWKLSSISSFTTKIGSGSTPKGGESSYKSLGIPLIRSMNIHFDRIKYDELAYIDEEQARKLDGVTVEENDVLLNITGASIGRVNIATSRLSGARVNQHVCIIRCVKNIVLPKYLYFYLYSPECQRWITEENYGATRQALTKGMIEIYEIKKPELKEQHEIVRRVEELFAFADQIEASVNIAQKRINSMTQSILAKAFRGDLTAKWRIENPELITGKNSAEALLEKIRGEKKERKVKQ